MTNYGIALCRVSTSKQRLEGNSLSAQEARINRVAVELFNCEIVRTWSLDISSRKGKNFNRKDLEEMLTYTKQDRRISFLFVDEHDRYMRSVDEYYMWKGRFLYEAGVTLVIAAKPELALNPNSASLAIEFFGVWQGETSNEERITKTTEKMQARITAGYYPGMVRTCYQKTKIKGLHEPLEPQWSLMQTAMKRILHNGHTVHQALKWLQGQGFKSGTSKLIEMDRFKKILKEPYYAGVVRMSNWDTEGIGLHKAMITKDEYDQLQDIISGVKKKFIRQVHNPDFQMANITECVECIQEKRKYAKLTGYRNHNGKRPEIRKYYERYICRGCNLGMTKSDLHDQMSANLKTKKTSEATKKELKEAMRTVWERRNEDSANLAERLEQKIKELTVEKDNLVRSIGSNPALAVDIAQSVEAIKAEILVASEKLVSTQTIDEDFNTFVEFSLGYVDNLNANWWNLTPERREICKQLTFPGGIFITKNKTVSTPDISAIYRYKAIKKTSEDVNSVYVNLTGGPGGTRTLDILLKRQTL